MITTLDTVISEYSVRNKENMDIPVYSVTNDKGFCTGYFSKDVASKDKTSYKIVPRGYFAYNPSRINVGSIDWQNSEDYVIVSPLYVVFGVSEIIDKQYLLYYLKSDIASTYINTYATGSVRDNLKLAELKKIPVKLPPLNEQRKIAAVLDKISELTAKRRRQLDKLDELVKSRFVEMFGDPIHNTTWQKLTLGECVTSIDNGYSYVCANEARLGNKPAILKLSAVTYGDFHPEENKAIIDEALFSSNAEIRAGDLLFTRKNTPALVGMCAYVIDTPPKLMMPDLIFRLNTNDKCNKIFLWKLINHETFRPCVEAIATGSAKSMSNISKERLKEMQIIVPDIDRQEQFADFIRVVEKSKSTIQRSLSTLETLKKSLMQKYFG